MEMLGRLSGLVFLFVACSAWAQHRYANKGEAAAIRRVKTVDVSSLDRGLPKVTLEFFLRYEGEGAPIKWQMNKCDSLNGNLFIDREPDSTICVEADIDLQGGRSVTVVVALGKLGPRPPDPPTFISATVTDQGGLIHTVRRLSDLPMELHRPLPKWPRDLPLPAGAASSFPRSANHRRRLMAVVISLDRTKIRPSANRTQNLALSPDYVS